MAVENQNVEMVKLILNYDDQNINIPSILI